jgi:hypothetical protein
VLAAGGYPAVGAASVLAGILAALVATRFPEHRTAAPALLDEGADDNKIKEDGKRRGNGYGEAKRYGESDGHGKGEGYGVGERQGHGEHEGEGYEKGEGDDLGWGASLRAGLTEVRADPAVRTAVLLLAVVTAVWGALDEYTPLLAAGTGVTRETVPMLLLLVWLGVTAGGLLTPLGERLDSRGYAVLLAGSGVALAAGALFAHPAGFVLVAIAFCGFQLATVLADARLQDRITGTSRATVTSLAGTATDVATIGVYGAYALVAAGAGNGVAFAVLSVPYLIVALAVTVRRTARVPIATPGKIGP